MHRSRLFALALLSGIWSQLAGAVDFTGRFSMLAASARAEAGDAGLQPGESNSSLSSDQQGLRLMLDEGTEQVEWSAHLRTVRTRQDGVFSPMTHSSELFRYGLMGGELMEDVTATGYTRLHYEMDRFYLRRYFDEFSVAVGRQPVEWGSGRFWQPLNVFGSFSPIDLDTDYKPGIDAVVVDYYPSASSLLTAVYAFAPHDQNDIVDSGAVHYRSQLGEQSELSLVAGAIDGNNVWGGAFESVWNDFGWRVEGVQYTLRDTDTHELFWIAGADYQFDDGTLMSVEYYDNSNATVSEWQLQDITNNELLLSGLQQYLGRRMIGIGLSRDLTPLLSGGYTLLGSVLSEGEGGLATSMLHQLNLTYSVSNESDLLMSLLLPNGRGLAPAGQPRSEFGHLPMSFTVRLRFYF